MALDTVASREITEELLLSATNFVKAKNESQSHFLKRITHLTLTGTGKKAIEKIQNLQLCPNAKVLYMYDNIIHRIENLDELSQLTHLYLQNNRIAKIENLERLHNLEKLYLNNNLISCLDGLGANRNLLELHLSNQCVSGFTFNSDTLHALAGTLQVLTLANCNAFDAKPLELLSNLRVLDLSGNNIKRLEDVNPILNLRCLAELDLRHNPVTRITKYREKIVKRSRACFAILDKRSIDCNQRKMMQKHEAHKNMSRQGQSNQVTEFQDETNNFAVSGTCSAFKPQQ